MSIKKLRITNFKNYDALELDFKSTLNCFVGKNGAGKTNLLDAIYYLCMCKSYFPVSDTDLVKKNSDLFRLFGNFQQQELDEIVAKFQIRRKKVFERNKIAYSKLSEHIGLIPVIMIAPDDIDLIKGGSDKRRKLIDHSLSQIDRVYLRHLIVYTKVLAQRNAFLKKSGKSGTRNEQLLSAYDQQMLEPAQYIHRARLEFLEEIQPKIKDFYKRISNDTEVVSLSYISKLDEHQLQDLLLRSRDKDYILQRTSEGIHKDDIEFIIDDGKVKSFASQGQRKSFLLSLKLAQSDILKQYRDVAPILLLDDIFDKLDVDRVKQLIILLSESQLGQIFITDTHEERIEEIIAPYGNDYQIFRIVDGRVED